MRCPQPLIWLAITGPYSRETYWNKCFVAKTRQVGTGYLFILHIAWSRDLYDLKTEPTPRFQELSCLPLCLTSAAPGLKEHLLQ
jgi:hypothetical protein